MRCYLELKVKGHIPRLLILFNLMLLTACFYPNTSGGYITPYTLADGQVELRLPQGLSFMSGEQFCASRPWYCENRQIEGVIYRSDQLYFEETGEFILVFYDDIGHVSDDDPMQINGSGLVKELMDDYPYTPADDSLDSKTKNWSGLVGWPNRPRYDPERHQLSWACTIQGLENGDSYGAQAVCALGRSGVLRMETFGDSDYFPFKLWTIQNFASFAKGHQYTDFDPSIDSLAGESMLDLLLDHVQRLTGRKIEEADDDEPVSDDYDD